jgi:exonuclease VII large subunit
MQHHLAIKQEQLKSALNRLEPLSPLHTLERGYSIATKQDDPKPITDHRTLKRGMKVVIQFAHGQALCQVLTTGSEVAPDEGAQTKLPGFS